MMDKCYESFQIIRISVTLFQGQGHKVANIKAKHSFVGIYFKLLLGLHWIIKKMYAEIWWLWDELAHR